MQKQASKPAKIAVMGLGYVGCVTSACLASIGHSVTGVDRDSFKTDCVAGGKAPFFEPGLDDLVAQGVEAGRLTASSSVADSVADADVALICVGTPSNQYGNLSLEQLDRVFAVIAETLPSRNKPLIIAVRSTVFPGTCDGLMERYLPGVNNVSIVSNPEFLRESTAVADFYDPSLIVVGGEDRASVERVGALYDALPVEPVLVSLRTAEMIKYACNAFHALKIAFANEIGTLAASLAVSPAEVMETLCKDDRLNISKVYLRPGFAFGGSCLPKDLRAMNYRAGRLNQNLPLLAAVLPSNERHLDRAIQAVMALPARKFGIYGLAFKEQTDDLRESPIVGLIEYLIGKGRQVRIYDPHVNLDAIYGSNKNFLLSALPHIGGALTGGLAEIFQGAEHLVLAQKPSAEDAKAIADTGLPVLNLVSASLDFVPRQPGAAE